jgi:hypothetical protein
MATRFHQPAQRVRIAAGAEVAGAVDAAACGLPDLRLAAVCSFGLAAFK